MLGPLVAAWLSSVRALYQLVAVPKCLKSTPPLLVDLYPGPPGPLDSPDLAVLERYREHFFGEWPNHSDGPYVDSLSPDSHPAVGETRYEHPEFGPYSVIDVGTGPSGSIFRSLDGFRRWELAGRPKLLPSAKKTPESSRLPLSTHGRRLVGHA